MDAERQMQGYSEAVRSGLYAKRTGLVGKYDNVRRYWEDEITRLFLRPHLQNLLDRCRDEVRRLRVMDLGCGSADGYELLTGVRHRDADLNEVEIDLLTPEVLGCYKGVDLNEDLLKQARDIYDGNPKLLFEQADLTKGVPIGPDEQPFDLYFASYGTCSHFNEDGMLVNLLADIARRTRNYSVMVCDWLGRYSYEWQSLWSHDLDTPYNMDYVVSYIYEKEEREERRDELQHLTLRLMSQAEAKRIFAKASELSGIEIKPLLFFDRSAFSGRHMDTGEYNSHAQPIREALNSLHEINVRTNLNTLLIDYVPKDGFEELNSYFEHFQMCWNAVVNFVDELLHAYDRNSCSFGSVLPNIPSSYPDPLPRLMERMRGVVEGVGWLEHGLPRENIIEPQLGYALRTLEMSLQRGGACAHGFGCILEIDKSR